MPMMTSLPNRPRELRQVWNISPPTLSYMRSTPLGNSSFNTYGNDKPVIRAG